MARSTVVPSATTHTASSSDQLGRDNVCPSAASTASPPRSPIHNDAAISGAPGRSVTTDATWCPLRDSAAPVWSVVRPNAPGTGSAACPLSDTSRPPISACTPAAAPSATPGSVAATSVGFHPPANRSSSGGAVGIDHVRPFDVCAGQRPNELGG